MVCKEAGNDLPQPMPLFGDRVMPSLSHLLLNFLELRPHAVASGFPFDLELSAAACSADEGEAQEVEGLRFSEPPMRAALRCEAAEPERTGLVRMECQRELRATAHRRRGASPVAGKPSGAAGRAGPTGLAHAARRSSISVDCSATRALSRAISSAAASRSSTRAASIAL